MLYCCLRYRKIGETKQSTTIEELCAGYPAEFSNYLKYARSLDFTETPDYERLIGMFKSLLIKQGQKLDWEFDWVEKLNKFLLKSQQQQQQQQTLNETAQLSKNNINYVSKTTTNENFDIKRDLVILNQLGVDYFLKESKLKKRTNRSSSIIRNQLSENIINSTTNRLFRNQFLIQQSAHKSSQTQLPQAVQQPQKSAPTTSTKSRPAASIFLNSAGGGTSNTTQSNVIECTCACSSAVHNQAAAAAAASAATVETQKSKLSKQMFTKEFKKTS